MVLGRGRSESGAERPDCGAFGPLVVATPPARWFQPAAKASRTARSECRAGRPGARESSGVQDEAVQARVAGEPAIHHGEGFDVLDTQRRPTTS